MSAQIFKFPKPLIPYWLCCGDLDYRHIKKRNGGCKEAMMGFPEHEHFGTVKEHKKWLDEVALGLILR